jgi:hypothetical protein
MKKTAFLLLVFFSIFSLHAQDCNNYVFLQNNKKIEMTFYTRRGEPNGKQVYNVTDVARSGNSVKATVNSEMFDKRGKSVSKTTGQYDCEGGVIKMNMKLNLSAQQMETFREADVKAEDVYIEYPASMKVGDKLKDGNLQMEALHNGMKHEMIMVVSDRNVVGKESVTTTAGTWDCFKITSKTTLTIKVVGVGFPMSFEQTEWFAPNFGIVKSESKNGSTAITAVN